MKPAGARMPARSRSAGARDPSAGQGGRILYKLLVAITILGVLGAIWMLRGPILRFAGELLVAEDALQPADAIIAIGDDNYPAERATRAAELYHGRWAPRVVASGRYLRPYASVADLMVRDLTDRGVPAKAILHFAHRATGTRGEAVALGKLFREERWRRVLVVTSQYHTRRAGFIFRDVLDPAIEVRMVAATDSDFPVGSWWQTREGRKIYFRESWAWVLALWESVADESSPPAAAPGPVPAR